MVRIENDAICNTCEYKRNKINAARARIRAFQSQTRLNAYAKTTHAVGEMRRRQKSAAPQKILPHAPPAVPAAKPAKKESESPVLQVRLDKDLNERYNAACAKVKLKRSTLGDIIVEAVVDLIEREGRITIPLRVTQISGDGQGLVV